MNMFSDVYHARLDYQINGRGGLIRLYGTEVDNLFGINDFRGKPISTLPLPAYERLHEHLMQVLKTRAPVRAFTDRSVLPKQDYKSAEDICTAIQQWRGH